MITNGIVYHDQYVKQDGSWRIAKRESNFIWTRTEKYGA
jgi:hypothetical protein